MKIINLFEKKTTDISNAQLKTLASCTEFLASAKGTPFYRGLLTADSFVNSPFHIETVRKDRRPKSSSIEFTNVANLAFESAFGVEKIRNAGTFVTTSFESAISYGFPAFVFFPNGYRAIGSKSLEDHWGASTSYTEQFEYFAAFKDDPKDEELTSHKIFKWFGETPDAKSTFPTTLKGLSGWIKKYNFPLSYEMMTVGMRNHIKRLGYKEITNSLNGFSKVNQKAKEIMFTDVDEVYCVSVDMLLRQWLDFNPNEYAGRSAAIDKVYEMLLAKIKTA